jgi:hypothetical protein
MKTTVSRYDFERAFVDADREENFSYEGLNALFDYFEDYEESTGEEIELDVITICCEYTEDTAEEIARNYSIDLTDCEDGDEQAEVVREYLEDNGAFVGEVTGGFVYRAF